MKKADGFLVMHDDSPMSWERYKEDKFNLYIGEPATIFPNRRKANQAIQATIRQRRAWLGKFPGRRLPIADDPFTKLSNYSVVKLAHFRAEAL